VNAGSPGYGTVNGTLGGHGGVSEMLTGIDRGDG
jgi:hypothetical protein